MAAESPSKPYAVSGSVYCLGADWVNWYLVDTGEGLVAVDAGLPGFAATLGEDLDRLGLADKPLVGVVLTHSDADHVGLVGHLARRGAPVYIHGEDLGALARPRPKGGEAALRHQLTLLFKPGFWRLAAEMARSGGLRVQPFAEAKPFPGDGRLPLPGEPVAIHTPGHTPGHCAIHFPAARALFVGDLLCTASPLGGGRRGPQPLPRRMNVDTARSLASLAAIAHVDADLVLPGHGPPFAGSPKEAVEQVRLAAGGR